jgi:hypothetical protein
MIRKDPAQGLLMDNCPLGLERREGNRYGQSATP